MVAFTIHLALLGKSGFTKLAKLNHYRAQLLFKKLSSIKNINVINKSFFNEFVIELPCKASIFLDKMLERNIMAGIEVSDNSVLVTVTELNNIDSIDNYVNNIKEIL